MGGLWADTAGLGLKGMGEKEARLVLLVIANTDLALSLAFLSTEFPLSLSLLMKKSGMSTGAFILSTFCSILLDFSLILKPLDCLTSLFSFSLNGEVRANLVPISISNALNFLSSSL